MLTSAHRSLLDIPPTQLRGVGPGNVLRVCWRQWRTEKNLARRGVHFRDTNPDRVAASYAAMTESEFDAVNGRQDWANWRTIPRALRGRVPNRPLRVLDLGCGTGSSTRVLAWFCPVGSRLTGYEIAGPLLACARRRTYRHQSGRRVTVDFVCQGVTEVLRDVEGVPLLDGSVDLVNASGVVGHHLNRTTVRPLVSELSRVFCSEGVALLDVGPTLSAAALRGTMENAGYAYLGHFRSWFGDATGAMVFRRAH